MKTVKVRIAVAVNADGNWNSSGWKKAKDSDAMDLAQEGLQEISSCEKVYWVEADIPIPEPEIVQGKVTQAQL